jgi:hypothetical protein
MPGSSRVPSSDAAEHTPERGAAGNCFLGHAGGLAPSSGFRVYKGGKAGYGSLASRPRHNYVPFYPCFGNMIGVKYRAGKAPRGIARRNEPDDQTLHLE